MKKLFNNLSNIWKVEELRKRILLTLFLILIYRIGSFIILPGVNYDALAAANADGGQNMLEKLLSLFSGGGFSNASVMALGIMPYISASIIMQLLGMAVPAVQKMQNEGESGRKKINNYTRILTIVICALQAPSYLGLYVESKGALPVDAGAFWWTQTIIVLVAGAMFAVWLGERITDKGIGNGISLLITVGILANLPSAFMAEIGFAVDSGNLIKIVLEIFMFMVVVLATVLIVQGVRKVPLNTAKRVVGARSAEEQGARNYLPIKVNASGVMPIIFAQAILMLPGQALSFLGSATDSKFLQDASDWFAYASPFYIFSFAMMILFFSYFWVATQFNEIQIADDLKRNGGYIPGVRPGQATTDFLHKTMSRITLSGAIFLVIISVAPMLMTKWLEIPGEVANFFGGTSLLIMVGVMLDTMRQMESHLLMRHYDGFMKKGRIRGRF